MQTIYLIISIVVIAIFFASCHNDVPGLPTVQEVEGYKYCKYANGCESTYKISEKSCADINFLPEDPRTLEEKKKIVLYCDIDCTEKLSCGILP